MPFVRVIHKGGCDFPRSRRLEEIKKRLKEIVSEFLSCSDRGGKLLPADVEVKIEISEPEDSLHEEFEVMFIIDANDFPSRKRNIDERSRCIAAQIEGIPEFQNLRGYVWTRLFPAAFITFGEKRA